MCDDELPLIRSHMQRSQVLDIPFVHAQTVLP